MVNKNKFQKSKNKINLVFDEEKRKEFLTGFHKRKLQRKKKAQEELQEQLKIERKRLKQEAKESYKKLTLSNRTIPEIEELLNKTEYSTNEVSVQIVELSENSIAEQNNWIGPNKPKYESDNEDCLNDASDVDEIEGMNLKKLKKFVAADNKFEFKTEKDVKKMIKKQATKSVQKSKAFQLKYKLDKQKMKKKSLQQKKLRIKVQNKKGKKFSR